MDNEVKSAADIITLKSGQKISCFDLSALKRKSDDSIAANISIEWGVRTTGENMMIIPKCHFVGGVMNFSNSF